MFARQQQHLHLPHHRDRLKSLTVGPVLCPVDTVFIPAASPIAVAVSRAGVVTAALVWSPLHLRNARKR